MNQLELINNYNPSNLPILSTWTREERLFKVEFPIWFKRYIDLFDSSLINNQIKVISPLTENESIYQQFLSNIFAGAEEIEDDFEGWNDFFPIEAQLFPFAQTIGGELFFWKKKTPNEIVLIDESNEVIDLKMNFFDFITNKNNILIDADFYDGEWLSNFHIESNLKAKVLSLFSNSGQTDINKIRDCLLECFNFNFKHKSEKSEFNTTIDKFNAMKKDNCAIQLIQNLDKSISMRIVYPIEMYNDMFEIIKKLESLNLYITFTGQHFI